MRSVLDSSISGAKATENQRFTRRHSECLFDRKYALAPRLQRHGRKRSRGVVLRGNETGKRRH